MASAAVLDFQGRVMQGNTPYHGQGNFHFALLDSQGSVVWTTGSPQSTATPPSSLMVSQGKFSIALGDPSFGQKPIGDRLTGQQLNLRVWFQGQGQGWDRLGEDLPVALSEAGKTMTAAQGDAILAELREIRNLLGRQQAPAAGQQRPATPLTPPTPQYVTVAFGKSPEIGSQSAPWVLMEFTDFQCPFCRRFSEEILPEIRKRWIDSGKVRFVARELPLNFHNAAMPAAKVATAAHLKGKYWELRDAMFSKSSSLTEPIAIEAAVASGLDPQAARDAMTSSEVQSILDADAAAAQAAGITGTPSFVFGTIKDGRLHGLKMVGASNAQTFLSQLEKEMNAQPAKPGGAP